MARYRVTGPDGATYEITAPDDATEAQVLNYAKSQAPRTGQFATLPASALPTSGQGQGKAKGYFDDLIPTGQQRGAGRFDDLIPQESTDSGPWEKYRKPSGPWEKYRNASGQLNGTSGPGRYSLIEDAPERGRYTLLDDGQNAPRNLRGVRDPAVLARFEYGLDLTRPDAEIRAAIEKLPETEKKRAQDIWADYRVQRMYEGTGFTPQPELATGIPILGSFLDEAQAAIQGVVAGLTANRVGRPYDEALAGFRAHERAAMAANPIRSTVGKLAAGIATGGPLFGRIAPAKTLLGRVGQGAAIGAGVGAAEGFGHGEGSPGQRVETAQEGASVGAGIGALLPIGSAGASRLYGAASDFLGPTVTRLFRGPEAAADRILAKRIWQEGSSPTAKQADLDQGQTVDARMAANSRAALPETLADTSDAMRRLTGSLYRQGGEPGNFVKEFLENRQRGTGNPFSPQPTDQPGQMGRVLDATQRALLLRTANSARKTERQIQAEQAREGKRLYDEARKNSQPFDIQPALDGMALVMQQYTGPFRARLRRAMDLFLDDSPNRMPVNNIARFDAAKKALDDMIEMAGRQGQGNLKRELTAFKDALLKRVHLPDESGHPTINKVYQEAREAWGSAAENREAIELGRAALRENSEVSVEQFLELTKGQQQLFRIGFLESLRNALGSKRPGDDVTRLFQTRRVRDLLTAIIPRSQSKDDVFFNRPERFGNLMEREARMVQTRNAVLGNSATQQRQMDDLQFAGDALANMWNRFRSSASVFNMGVELVGVGIQKIFGYNQKVALAMARSLLEADPAKRNQILQRLAQRGGPGALERFAIAVDRSANALTAATAGPLMLEDQRPR